MEGTQAGHLLQAGVGEAGFRPRFSGGSLDSTQGPVSSRHSFSSLSERPLTNFSLKSQDTEPQSPAEASMIHLNPLLHPQLPNSWAPRGPVHREGGAGGWGQVALPLPPSPSEARHNLHVLTVVNSTWGILCFYVFLHFLQ